MWQLFSLELDGEINNQGDQISGCCALVFPPLWPITSSQP